MKRTWYVKIAEKWVRLIKYSNRHFHVCVLFYNILSPFIKTASISLLISAYDNISSLWNMAAQTVIKGKIIYYGCLMACVSSKSRKLLKRKHTGWEQDREQALSDSCRSPWLPKIISKTNQPETRVGKFMYQEESCLSISINSSTQKHLWERHDKALQEC